MHDRVKRDNACQTNSKDDVERLSRQAQMRTPLTLDAIATGYPPVDAFCFEATEPAACVSTTKYIAADARATSLATGDGSVSARLS